MFWYIYGTVLVICHVPITVDILRLVRPQCKIPRVTGLISKYILGVLAGVAFCVAILQHFTVFLPVMAPRPLHSLYGMANVVFSLWVWLNVTIHFYMALLLHPGEDKELPCTLNDVGIENRNRPWNGNTVNGLTYRNNESINSNTIAQTSQLDLPVLSTNSTDDGSKAQTGMEWSPKRSNYCRVCQVNVAYADHHCPYIGKCLGVNNYAHFYLLMIYGLLGMLYALYVTLPYFYRCDIRPLFGLTVEEDHLEACQELGTQSRASIPVIIALWIISNMTLIQTFFLLADISTFNVLKNTQRVPVLRFAWERVKGRLWLRPHSRLNVLIRKRRPNILYYILPLRNRNIRPPNNISVMM